MRQPSGTALLLTSLVLSFGVEVRGQTPLPDLEGTYLGEEGGLYGAHSNDPPADHLELALRLCQEIQPLSAVGLPSAKGKIGLIAIGQSTTETEFAAFSSAWRRIPSRNSRLVLVNGCQSGVVSRHWAREGHPWSVLFARVRGAGLSALQVQAAWIEVAPVHGEQYGSFAAFVSGHAAELAEIIRVAKSSYPNLLVAYLSSRIYAGYAAFSASPEPFAYQSAFAVRRVILEQAEGARSLNADPLRGPVAAPVLLWGPYLWSNGARPRRDGFAWQRGDFERDGVHPNARGSSKAGRYLLSFMLNDPTSRDWVRRGFEARP